MHETTVIRVSRQKYDIENLEKKRNISNFNCGWLTYAAYVSKYHFGVYGEFYNQLLKKNFEASLYCGSISASSTMSVGRYKEVLSSTVSMENYQYLGVRLSNSPLCDHFEVFYAPRTLQSSPLADGLN